MTRPWLQSCWVDWHIIYLRAWQILWALRDGVALMTLPASLTCDWIEASATHVPKLGAELLEAEEQGLPIFFLAAVPSLLSWNPESPGNVSGSLVHSASQFSHIYLESAAEIGIVIDWIAALSAFRQAWCGLVAPDAGRCRWCSKFFLGVLNQLFSTPCESSLLKMLPV